MTSSKPHILITNDDGVRAPGINALIKIVSKDYKITVVAPEYPQSGKSHAFTSEKPIRVHKLEESKNFSRYSCEGTPVDCVKMAVNNIIGAKPDLVLSGINAGANTANSVFYSGTVGAAVEGSFFNIPSIALSLCLNEDKPDYTRAAEEIKTIIATTLKQYPKSNKCLNVNIPNTESKGIKICRQTLGNWKEEFERRKDPFGKNYFWISGYFENFEPDAEDTDEWAVNNDYIAIVPLQTNLTDFKSIEELKEIL